MLGLRDAPGNGAPSRQTTGPLGRLRRCRPPARAGAHPEQRARQPRVVLRCPLAASGADNGRRACARQRDGVRSGVSPGRCHPVGVVSPAVPKTGKGVRPRKTRVLTPSGFCPRLVPTAFLLRPKSKFGRAFTRGPEARRAAGPKRGGSWCDLWLLAPGALGTTHGDGGGSVAGPAPGGLG